jgi:hypothetical protein
MIAAYPISIDNWSHIHERDCAILVEDRPSPLSDEDIALLLDRAPFVLRADGDAAVVPAMLADLPDALQRDIAALTERFMVVMQIDAVRVRFEGVATNACKKVHADYTDVRLITTYAGPGTDYSPHGEGDCCLERVPTGSVALFKGRTFHPDHPPCFHRSPPIEGTDQRRLVLVIDTPLRSQD